MIVGVPETFVAMSPLGLMVLYFIGTSLTIANYSGYMRFNNDVYGDGFVRSYLVFTIFGCIGYYLAAGPAWLWAAKYSETFRQRVTRTAVGMGVIFFLHDLPVFIMEWHAILCCGWRNDFQSFVFIVQILEFAVSFTFGWLGYTYVMSGVLEGVFGDTALRNSGGGGLKTGAEVVQILPPMSAVSTPMLANSGSRGFGGGGGERYSPREAPQPVPFPSALDSGRSMRHQQHSGRGGDTRTPLSRTGSVRWAGSESGPSPRIVPLREGLADKRDLDDDYDDNDDDDSLDGDDAYYAGSARGGGGGKAAAGYTFGGPSNGDGGGYHHSAGPAPQRYGGGTAAAAFSPRDVEMSSRASSRPQQPQPMSYSLPPVTVSGARAMGGGGDGGGFDDEDATPPTAPMPAGYGGGDRYASHGGQRRLGSVFIERTTI